MFQNVTEVEFQSLVDEIFERISLIEKWKVGREVERDQRNCVGAASCEGSVEAVLAGEGAAVPLEGSLGDGAAVLGDGAAVLGDGAAVLGDGGAVLGDGVAASGEGSALLSHLSALFGAGSATRERSTTSVEEAGAGADEMLDFHLGKVAEFIHLEITFYFPDLIYNGILMLAQKSSSQYGDGEGSLAFWKNSIADYHDEKKVFYLILIAFCTDHIFSPSIVFAHTARLQLALAVLGPKYRLMCFTIASLMTKASGSASGAVYC